MHDEDFGEVSRELFSQFLYRIRQEFKGKTAFLGLFSKIKYLNSNNDQKLRDRLFHYQFVSGFIFSSSNFSGTSSTSSFPVGFLVWNLTNSKKIEEQDIHVDVFNDECEKIGTKQIYTKHKTSFLSKWIERERGVDIFPPVSSSINIKVDGPDIRDRISEGFLGSLMCKGNELVNQNSTAIFSAPYASAGALSITKNNFEKSMMIHAVRRIPKQTWINDRDQFYIPISNPSQEFILDCLVWNLFSNSNETVSVADVEYKGKPYQIKNHFFPFVIALVKDFEIQDREIKNTLVQGKDSFVAKYLSAHPISGESKEVLEGAKLVYQCFYSSLNALDTRKHKITQWDAGWWQVRQSLLNSNKGDDQFSVLRERHEKLKLKIASSISLYGFVQ